MYVGWKELEGEDSILEVGNQAEVSCYMKTFSYFIFPIIPIGPELLNVFYRWATEYPENGRVLN